MSPTGPGDLIHDWNRLPGEALRPGRGRVELDDETLRDGLQSPSVRTPSIEDRLRMLHCMADLGIEAANIGLPGAGPHVARDTLRLAQEIASAKLPIFPNCAARTLESDVLPVVEIAQQAGIAIEVACFLGSSPVRQYAEGWTIDRLLRLTEEAVTLAAGHGMPVMYVTEDTTRARPEDLRRLYTTAVEAGARRVCVADTVGHATPAGAAAVVRFVGDVVGACGGGIGIDWHGHRDRDFAVINTLAALDAGATRLHGTAIGIGERVGNTPMDMLLVNLVLMGYIERDLSALLSYCETVSAATGVPIPANYPVVGRDAFRTATGVHAAAVIKAFRKHDHDLVDAVYSGVPAGLVGREQEVEIGPLSGRSNVLFWLEKRGLKASDEAVDRVFAAAKGSDCILSDAVIRSLLTSE